MSAFLFETPDEIGRARLGDILAHGFGFPPDDYQEWFERGRHENLRVLRRDGRIVAGLLQIQMGQFFGGASIPSVGIAGVGVAVDERGGGVAKALMVAALREARAKGIPLSTLYPATVTLYRRAGYERAGARFRVEVDPRVVDVERSRNVSFREIPGLSKVDDIPSDLRSLYTSSARGRPGYVDRGPYAWSRVIAPRGHTTKTFTAHVDGRLEGYVVLSNKVEGHGTALLATDLVARSPHAARAILRLLAEYRSIAEKVTWFGGAVDTFTSLLPERYHVIKLEDFFMLRVVDVARALSARGYPRLLATDVTLEVDDSSLPENSGVFTLSIEGGKGRVTEGAKAGAPRVRLDERALATLYAGHTSVATLVETGWIEGDEDSMTRLSAIFAGPAPSMCDVF